MIRVRSSLWPLPHVLLVPAAAIALVVLFSTWSMMPWPYPRWGQTSAQWHQQFAWAGPIAGAAACYYAVRVNTADRIWSQPRAPRLGSAAVGRHLTLLIAWFVGAYALALLPLTLAAAVRGAIGSPAPLVILSGVLAMTAAIGLGYVLGTLVHSMVIVPITALALYALFVLSNAGADTFAPVAPVLYLEPQLGQTESTPLVVFRVALFLLLTGSTAALAATVLHRRSSGQGRNHALRAADITLYAIAPVALIAVALANQPALFTVEPEPAQVCGEARGMTYCVHAANEPQLPALIAAFDPVFARYGTEPLNIQAVWDESLVLGGELRTAAAGSTVIIPLRADGVIDAVPSGVIESLTGVRACMTAPATEQSGDLTTVQLDLAAYLTGGSPPSGTFAGMSERQVQDWIRGHQRQLSNCTLTLRDVPRA
ncbi:hypothetical protein [Amycolatopsis palatopharyngis]|uniref:hypothetical protein n=1 Tax=Amycolatopsis palatopharyngis TaxID=187982 RepID=UPI000E221E3F|nr:hypothetical protein [Amycolatopsis palatopharyngis]